jgi:hypothetical protein
LTPWPDRGKESFSDSVETYKLFGVDVTQIPGLEENALPLFSEVGRDMSRWPSAGNFVSCYRRMRAKLGAPKAITATAHKLARILYHMVTTGHAYDETICAQNEVQNRKRMEARLRKQARQFGLQLVAL